MEFSFQVIFIIYVIIINTCILCIMIKKKDESRNIIFETLLLNLFFVIIPMIAIYYIF